MARPRYQRGQLIEGGVNWLGRWREDVADDTGAVKRVHKKEVIASKKECPTKQMARRKLNDLLRKVNGESLGLSPDLHTIEVVLCNSCRERLIAALQANE
jgi:ribosome modulation factor